MVFYLHLRTSFRTVSILYKDPMLNKIRVLQFCPACLQYSGESVYLTVAAFNFLYLTRNQNSPDFFVAHTTGKVHGDNEGR